MGERPHLYPIITIMVKGRGGRKKFGGRGGRRGRRGGRGVTTGFRGRRVGKARAPPTTAVKPTRPGPRMNMRNVKQKQYSFRRQRREFNPQRGISEKVVSFNFSIPWAQIKFTALNAVQVIMTSSGSACGGQLYIYPQNSFYFPGIVYNQIRQWQYYIVRQHRMRWTSRFGSQTNSTVTCSFFDDPGYFEGQGVGDGNLGINETLINYAACCRRWPVWKNMDCMPYKGTGKWMQVTGTTQTGFVPFSDTIANTRECVSGVYGITCDNNPTLGSAVTVGDIYLDITISVKEMAAGQTANVTFMEHKYEQLLHKLTALQLDMKVAQHAKKGEEMKLREVKEHSQTDLSLEQMEEKIVLGLNKIDSDDEVVDVKREEDREE